MNCYVIFKKREKYCNDLQNFDDIIFTRSRNSHRQASASQGSDDFGGGIGAKNQPAGGHVLFHCPPESMLGILGQFIHLSKNNHYRETTFYLAHHNNN